MKMSLKSLFAKKKKTQAINPLEVIGQKLVRVTTANGSRYSLVRRDNKVFVLIGLREGVVEKFNAPMVVGGSLDIDYRFCNPYTCEESEDVSLLRTSKIESIVTI